MLISLSAVPISTLAPISAHGVETELILHKRDTTICVRLRSEPSGSKDFSGRNSLKALIGWMRLGLKTATA
jgi:hypothetical protein